MKKIRPCKKLFIILIVLCLAIASLVIHFIISQYVSNWKGSYVRYDEMLLSANGEYFGIIDTAKDKVLITDYSGKIICDLDTRGDSAQQIALGKNSFFLLHQWEDEKGAGRIVQYDYQSNKMKESVADNIATIAYRDGYLFIGEWKKEEEDLFYHFIPFSNGFYANYYCKEEAFANELKNLKPNHEQMCMVGNLKMYYHQDGYFSMNPTLDDYLETSIGTFTAEDKVSGYGAKTEQETKNRTLVLNKIGNMKEIQKPIYEIYEYQSGTDIYGVCNIYEKRIPSRPVQPKNVIKSYCYKIRPKENEIKIMGQTNSCLGIIASNFYFIYQKENMIIRQNLKSGDEKVICELEKEQNTYYIQGDYLLIVGNDKCIPVKWNVG